MFSNPARPMVWLNPKQWYMDSGVKRYLLCYLTVHAQTCRIIYSLKHASVFHFNTVTISCQPTLSSIAERGFIGLLQGGASTRQLQPHNSLYMLTGTVPNAALAQRASSLRAPARCSSCPQARQRTLVRPVTRPRFRRRIVYGMPNFPTVRLERSQAAARDDVQPVPDLMITSSDWERDRKCEQRSGTFLCNTECVSGMS